MQLTLSNTALPGASLDDLRRAARRRSLQGLELVLGAGDGPPLGTACEGGQGEHPPSDLQEKEFPIRWLVMPPEVAVSELLYWGGRAHLMRAGLVIRRPADESLAGVPLALLHGTDPEAAQQAAAWARLHGGHTCWEVALEEHDPHEMEDVLNASGPHLAHVRLLGGGPESQQEAAGTGGRGALFSQLALRGYAGTIALAPSGPGREEAWRTWLFDRRGWGCGTAAQKKAARAS